MAIRRPPTTFSDTISTADIADDAITGGKLANDIAISTTGNIATTGSGTLTVAGNTTLSGTNNLGSNPTLTLGSNATFPAGHVIQTVQYVETARFVQDLSGATHQVLNNGSADFAVSITTKQANSKIMVQISIGQMVGHTSGSGHGVGGRLLRDITGGTSNVHIGVHTGTNTPKDTMFMGTDSHSYDGGMQYFQFLDSPAQSAGTTIKYKIGVIGHLTSGTYTIKFNANNNESASGTHGYQSNSISTFTAQEISV